MKLRYTILYVDDVQASLAFYTAAFGLEVGFLHESKDYGELVTGETKLAFSSRALMESLGKKPALPQSDAHVFEIAFETDNVTAGFERAVNAGGKIVQPVEEMPWGQTTSYISDPDGYLVEICSPVNNT
jgi:lactoylglutathione lyase